jgi:hypothetical protein
MDSQELREFVASYASELADLTFNSKPIINTLTMLASENLAAASSIAAAIERHILMVSAVAKPLQRALPLNRSASQRKLQHGRDVVDDATVVLTKALAPGCSARQSISSSLCTSWTAS